MGVVRNLDGLVVPEDWLWAYALRVSYFSHVLATGM